MSVIEANPRNHGCISIVYATPVGGKREYRFNHGYEVAQHVSANHPGLFVGVPDTRLTGTEYRNEMKRQRDIGWRMDWKDAIHGK